MNLINQQQDQLRGSTTWIAKALKVERVQIMLAIDAWQLNTSGTEIQQLSIAQCQDWLQSQLEGLVASATQFLGEEWDDDVELDTALQFQDDQADGEE